MAEEAIVEIAMAFDQTNLADWRDIADSHHSSVGPCAGLEPELPSIIAGSAPTGAFTRPLEEAEKN